MPTPQTVYAKDYWTGDSRDGFFVNGDGYHYFRMYAGGLIIEAYEVYEADDGAEVVTPMPEMHNVHWIADLGFEDLGILEMIDENEFMRVRSLCQAVRDVS